MCSPLLWRWAPLLAVPVLALACSDEPAIGEEPDAVGGEPEPSEPEPSEPEPAPQLDASTAPAECEVPIFEDDSAAVPFEHLEARVVDTDGEPLSGVKAQACGVNLCLFADTDASGRVVHQGPRELQRAAFKYGDGIRQAQIAFLLDDEPEHLLGDQITLLFPDLDDQNAFEPGATVRSEGIELEIGGDVGIELDELTYGEDERVFVAREFPADAFPEAAASENFAMLFALGPAHTTFCPPAKLVLPNSAELPAGQELSIYYQSTETSGAFALYGSWAEVSTATVSADGERIETDADHGLPVLGVIGLR